MLELCGKAADAPSADEFERWCAHTLGAENVTGDVSVALVEAARSQELNRDYRGKDEATNVLAFPAGEAPDPAMAAELPLGDLVLCPEVIRDEARAQGKPLEAHYAHLLVHGVLHLLGYDHQQDDQAAVMESRERELLAELGFSDPYATTRRDCA